MPYFTPNEYKLEGDSAAPKFVRINNLLVEVEGNAIGET